MYNDLYIVENTKNTFSEEFFSNTFITAIFDDVCNIVAFLADTGSQFLCPSHRVGKTTTYFKSKNIFSL